MLFRSVDFVHKYEHVFAFKCVFVSLSELTYNLKLFSDSQTFMNHLDKQNKECNYTGYLKNYVTYPPNGLLPVPGDNVEFTPGCDLWTEIYEAALIINPAFNIYRIFDQVSILIFPKLLVQVLIDSSVVATPVGRPGLPVRQLRPSQREATDDSFCLQ